MKRIAVGLLWALVLMWAGNYLSLLTGLSPSLMAFSAVAAGTLIAIAPVRLVQARAQARRAVAPATSSSANDHLARI